MLERIPAFSLRMQTTSTFGLIERFQNGDQEAFAQLFAKYKGRLAVLLHYRMSAGLRDRIEVDDLLQEVFLEAAQQMDAFVYRSPGSFFAWLARIADHTVVDQTRYEGRRKRRAEEMLRFRSPSNPLGPEPVDADTPSRVYSRQENLQLLYNRLDALPEEDRRVILFAKIEGLSTAEIAERLGKSRAAVALLLHRALKRFRESGAPGKQA